MHQDQRCTLITSLMVVGCEPQPLTDPITRQSRINHKIVDSQCRLQPTLRDEVNGGNSTRPQLEQDIQKTNAVLISKLVLSPLLPLTESVIIPPETDKGEAHRVNNQIHTITFSASFEEPIKRASTARKWKTLARLNRGRSKSTSGGKDNGAKKRQTREQRIGGDCKQRKGLGSFGAIHRLQSLIRLSSPNLIFLWETKLWGGAASSVKGVRSFSRYHIDAIVNDDKNNTWRFTGFYGHLQPSQRKHSWELLRCLHSLMHLPWCCMLDFNAILCMDEKTGGSEKCGYLMDWFCSALDDCGPQDLGFKGPTMTWNNGRHSEANAQERIDRAVVCSEWQDLFQNGLVDHMDF
ncbi:Endonuclease/exonuclease/phosphatase [Parasponia andersonii]|uniref:Endonuclease/exonuclease/phosphatase n=1 Tax=Parasponia andersonii TaxID=3476 RepID=A0A2P5BKH4_PARAD|nr:Endonuclease/exonuclease/phosphatase [Parasponia andersonii]